MFWAFVGLRILPSSPISSLSRYLDRFHSFGLHWWVRRSVGHWADPFCTFILHGFEDTEKYGVLGVWFALIEGFRQSSLNPPFVESSISLPCIMCFVLLQCHSGCTSHNKPIDKGVHHVTDDPVRCPVDTRHCIHTHLEFEALDTCCISTQDLVTAVTALTANPPQEKELVSRFGPAPTWSGVRALCSIRSITAAISVRRRHRSSQTKPETPGPTQNSSCSWLSWSSPSRMRTPNTDHRSDPKDAWPHVEQDIVFPRALGPSAVDVHSTIHLRVGSLQLGGSPVWGGFHGHPLTSKELPNRTPQTGGPVFSALPFSFRFRVEETTRVGHRTAGEARPVSFSRRGVWSHPAPWSVLLPTQISQWCPTCRRTSKSRRCARPFGRTSGTSRGSRDAK